MEENQVVINVTQKWDEIIAQWKESGKIASEWCRENNVNYKAFLYRRERFFRNQSIIQRSSFIELPEAQPTKSGNEIQIKYVSLTLHKEFDPSTLTRCLEALVKIC